MRDEAWGCESVLVVEDDDRLRAVLVETLAAAGYDVVDAAAGTDALASAATSPPDLVLLDVVLPGLSGYEVCRLLRERFGESLPILFMSGERVESFDRVAGLSLGGDEYLVKPFDLELLLALVRKHQRRLQNERRAASRADLTARQLEVLGLLADGLSQTEIAKRLAISPKTVGAHVEHIFVKLGVHSRAQAVARAFRDHLLAVA